MARSLSLTFPLRGKDRGGCKNHPPGPSPTQSPSYLGQILKPGKRLWEMKERWRTKLEKGEKPGLRALKTTQEDGLAIIISREKRT